MARRGLAVPSGELNQGEIRYQLITTTFDPSADSERSSRFITSSRSVQIVEGAHARAHGL